MLQKTNEMDQGNCVTFAAALNGLLVFIKYSTQLKGQGLCFQGLPT